ncbi:BTAD domain-containing putative transcriptional regulator [Nocardioides sp. C4-1]|uniref:BTAD domain-containing putative transcriptional regulator n=1 Tax=Nocardioides sp. C4-1 TaxID=3151851 RepID=UPI003266ADEF
MSDVAVRVLGPLQLGRDGVDSELMPALRSLLAALVVDAPRVVSADTLLARLWDDDDGSTATLHSYVSRLRGRLGPGVLVTQAPGYRLDLAPDAVDAVRFAGLLRAARQEPDPATARGLVAEAVGLWRGEAFADVPQRFARAEATRLGEQLLEAHELAADLDLRLGRHRAVVDALTPLVGREPLREGLRGALIVALYRSGRQAAALEAYDEGRRLLADELGVDPGPELRRLHEQVLRQDPALDPPGTDAPVGPPAATGATAPPAVARPVAGATPLLEPPNALVGREELVDEVAALLTGASRLTTLTGAGGVGKTRLALAVTARVRQAFADGVVTVPLATVLDAALVLPTIAHALGRALPGPADAAGDLRHGLVAALDGRQVLLLLDNLEHLLEAATDVAWLAASCPGLTVLVTSRAPLRVAGEAELLVDPLAVPTSVGDAEASPAVTLFVTRAKAVARSFQLDDATVGPVTEICRRLGGIPLAIELAAARVRVLAPDVLLDRLDEALASGARDLPERQRTMRATLDWSYRLLDEPAQRLFRDLAVFSGGWTLELLHDVLGPDVVVALEDLVEHSLVTVSWSLDAQPRYSMLEPIQQHARRLIVPDEHDAAVAAHAAACLALAERAARGYMEADQVRWLQVVDAEHANLLAAIERSTASGDHDTVGRITFALWLYWWMRGHSVLGRRLAATAATLPLATDRTRNRATIALAAMAFAQGDHEAAGAAWAGARDGGARLGDVEAEAHSEAGLGIVAISRGDLETAQRHHRRAIALAETLGRDTDGPWILTTNHVWLGTALLESGEREEALDLFRRGRRLADERGDRLGAFLALWNLARTQAGTDDAEAHRHLSEGIRLSHEVGDLANLSFYLDALVVVELRRDDLGRAEHRRLATLLGAAEACRDLGNSSSYSGYYLPDDDARDAAIETLRRDLGATAYDDAVRAGRVLGVDGAVALALSPR